MKYGDYGVVVAQGFVEPLVRDRYPIVTPMGNKKTKIIFVQGIKTGNRYQRYLKNRIENLGLECVDFPEYFNLHDYEKIYSLKKNVENEILESAEKVVLVAHSLGGILAMSLSDECYKKIDKILTIASPHLVQTDYIKDLKIKLNYQSNLSEKFPNLKIYSCGFCLDRVVKRKNTNYNNSIYTNFFADHGIMLFTTNFLLKKILKWAKII